MNFDLSLAARRSQEIAESFAANLPNYALALAIVLLAILAGVFAGRQVRGIVARTGAHYGVRNLLGSITRIGFIVIGVMIGLGILGADAAAIVAGAGVAGLVIGIAFKDILVAVVGFDDGAVRLHARLWTDSLGATVNRVSIQSRIRIKEALDEAGIAMAPGAVGALLAAAGPGRTASEEARAGAPER